MSARRYAVGVRALLLISLAGCTSVGAFQRAETLPLGAMEAAVESHLQLSVGRDSFSTLPMWGVRGRFGLSSFADVTVRFGPAGLEAQPKFMLTTRDAPVVVSLAPSLGGTMLVPNNLFGAGLHLSLPLYVGVALRGGHQVLLVPRVHDALTVVSAGQVGGTVNVLSAGGAVGVAISAGPVDLVPDIGFLVPIATTTWRSDFPAGTALGSARITLQTNFSIALRSKR